jgi:hypothetical protein
MMSGTGQGNRVRSGGSRKGQGLTCALMDRPTVGTWSSFQNGGHHTFKGTKVEKQGTHRENAWLSRKRSKGKNVGSRSHAVL